MVLITNTTCTQYMFVFLGSIDFQMHYPFPQVFDLSFLAIFKLFNILPKTNSQIKSKIRFLIWHCLYSNKKAYEEIQQFWFSIFQVHWRRCFTKRGVDFPLHWHLINLRKHQVHVNLVRRHQHIHLNESNEIGART